MKKGEKKKYLAACLLVFVLCTADHLTDVFLPSDGESLAGYFWRDFMLKLNPGEMYSLIEVVRSVWILFLSLFFLGSYMWEPYACSAVYVFSRNHNRQRLFAKRIMGLGAWIFMLSLSYGTVLLITGLCSTGETMSLSSFLTILYVMVYVAETAGIFVVLSNIAVVSLGEVIGCSLAVVMILICILLQQKDELTLLNTLNPLFLSFESAFCMDAVKKLLINGMILLAENGIVIRRYAGYDIIHQDTMI